MNTMLFEALREFTTGLLNQLLVNLSGRDGQVWMAEFKKFLRKEPCWVSKAKSFISKTFDTQSVDYDRPVEASVKAGGYDWGNSSITDEKFPSEESGKKEVVTALFHFNQSISSDEAITLMEQEGFRPSTMKELLAFGEKNPEEQRNYPIIALGSVAHLDGYRSVGYLRRDGSGRSVGLSCDDGDWHSDYRFLAVRN